MAHGENFWVAVDQDTVLGTAGLLNIGHGDLALRKMFVAPGHRGKGPGVAAALLAAALDWSAANGFARILLVTTDQFKAAHRFYE